MVIKKGKDKDRSEKQNKCTTPCPNYLSTSTCSATFPIDYGNERLTPNVKYSLNKRNRWLLPDVLRQTLSYSAFEETAPEKKAFGIVEHQHRYSCYTAEKGHCRLTYYEKKYDAPIDVGGTGRRTNCSSVRNQLDRGKFYDPKRLSTNAIQLKNRSRQEKESLINAWYEESRPNEVDWFNVWHCQKSLSMSEQGSFDHAYRHDLPRGKLFSEVTKDDLCDELCKEIDEIDNDSYDDNMSIEVPQLKSLTLGNIMQNCDLMRTKLMKKKKKKEKRHSDKTLVVEKSKTLISPIFNLTREGSDFGPVSIVLPLASVKSCSMPGLVRYELSVPEGALFAFTFPPAPWWLYLRYSNDKVCNVTVSISSKLGTNILFLQEAYASLHDLMSDIRPALLVENEDIFNKMPKKHLLLKEVPLKPLELLFPFTTSEFMAAWSQQLAEFRPEPCKCETQDVVEARDLGEKAVTCKRCSHRCAFRPCNHQVCSLCLIDSLTAAVDGGYTSFFWPHPSCANEFEDAMLVLLIGVDSFEKICANREKLLCECSCGTLLRVTEPSFFKNGLSIICHSCKKSLCFRCRGDPHWPASCQEAKVGIVEKMKANAANFLFGYITDKGCLLCRERESLEKAVKQKPARAYVQYCRVCGNYHSGGEGACVPPNPCWFCGDSIVSRKIRFYGNFPVRTKQVRPLLQPSASIRANWVSHMQQKIAAILEPEDIAGLSEVKLHIDEGRSLGKFDFAQLAATSFSEYHRISAFSQLLKDNGWRDPKVAEVARSYGNEMHCCVVDFCETVLTSRYAGQQLINQCVKLDDTAFRSACYLAMIVAQRKLLDS